MSLACCPTTRVALAITHLGEDFVVSAHTDSEAKGLSQRMPVFDSASGRRKATGTPVVEPLLPVTMRLVKCELLALG